ncbi:MAG: hypothetical protein ACKVTZ_19430 [Bacteroidia bacterium]
MADLITPEIKTQIESIVAETNPNAYIVEMKFKRSKRSVLLIRVDTDLGISLEECILINKAIGKWLEEQAEDFWDFEYNLDVTSPGVGEPLVLKRQYHKEIGRKLRVVRQSSEIEEGELLTVSDTEIQLKRDVPKAKQKVTSDADLIKTIPFDGIKEAKVVVVF